MKSNDCPRSTPDGKGLLISDPSGRFTILQPIESLEKADDGILSAHFLQISTLPKKGGMDG